MNPPAAIVHLVDDDASFLRAASRLLHAAGFRVQTFSSAATLLAQVTPDTRGCVVADLHMPGVSGLDLQEALVNHRLTLPVVFLTGAGDIPSTVRAMRHGAEDFLEKRAPQKCLLAAVNRALARDARESAGQARLQALRATFDALTPREREVLSHVVRGRLNKQIAADLEIHERTVKLHRTAITNKLNVHSVAELTWLVQVAGLFAESDPAFPNGQ